MDRDRYLVRPFGEDDVDEVCRLENLASPEFRQTSEDEREWDRLMAKKHLTLERWLVEERSSGSAVAYAALNHDLFSFDPHKFYVGVVVDPRHRGQGIGRTLAGLLDSEALDHRATAFWLNVRKDDARSLRFAERSGFEELRSSWMSELDLATVPEPAPPHDVPGIHFTTLAEEGVTSQEVRRRILDVTNESSRDVPRLGEFSPLSPEHFDALLDSSTNIPEAYLLARDGSEYVAVSNLQKDLAQPDSLFIGFTGTRRAYRGRGIASELKLRGIAYAKRAGFRYIRTFNDSLNEPIWKINEKLGFRRSVEWSNRERRFAPTPTGGSTPSGR